MKQKTIFRTVLFASFIAVTVYSTNLNTEYKSSGELSSLCFLRSIPIAHAECEYKLNGECEFKCDNTPNETCKGETTIDRRKLRVTCDGKEVEC